MQREIRLPARLYTFTSFVDFPKSNDDGSRGDFRVTSSMNDLPLATVVVIAVVVDIAVVVVLAVVARYHCCSLVIVIAVIAVIAVINKK